MMHNEFSLAVSTTLCAIVSVVLPVLMVATFGQGFRLSLLLCNFDSALLASTFGLLTRNIDTALLTVFFGLNAFSFVHNTSG
jgi:hypothetical protein